jgi:hypothetical protein
VRLFNPSLVARIANRMFIKRFKNFKNVAAGKAETERRMLRQTMSENAKTVAFHTANIGIENTTRGFIFIYLKKRLLKLHAVTNCVNVHSGAYRSKKHYIAGRKPVSGNLI